MLPFTPPSTTSPTRTGARTGVLDSTANPMKLIALSCGLLTLAALTFTSVGNAQTTQVRPTTGRALAGPVEAVNIVLHDGQQIYTVPMGQVLTIENFIWALEGSATHQSVAIIPGNDPAGVGDFLLKFSATQPDMFTPERPIKIVGDGTAGVRIINNTAVDWRDVLITGTLRDA